MAGRPGDWRFAQNTPDKKLYFCAICLLTFNFKYDIIYTQRARE